MKRTVLSVILALAVPVLVSMPAWAQDARQRTVLTVVQDALAQLPAQTGADMDREMADIAGNAPESVEILAGMLVPASEGRTALAEYAIDGVVNFVSESGNGDWSAPVREGLASGLDKCQDIQCKAFLLSCLSRIATAEDIPVFLRYAGDTRLGSAAVNALISVDGSEDAIMSLIESDGASRPLLAYAAAEKGLDAAEPYLLEWIRDLDGNADADSDASCGSDTPDMRAFLHALSRCGSRASLKILRKESVYDYVSLLGRIAGKGDCSTAVVRAERLLESDDANIRCAALELLFSVLGAGAEKYAIAAMDSPDRDYRCAALELASDFAHDSYLCSALSEVLESAGPEVRTDIVNWAGAYHVEAMLPDVLSYIPAYSEGNTPESPELAISAIRAAGLIGGDTAADALVRQLSGDADYAQAACRALLSFDGDIESRLRPVLEGSDPQAVRHALSLASARRMTGLSPQVFSLLGSEDSMVRRTAYQSLAGVVSLEDCTLLGDLLGKADTEFRISALQKALLHALRNLPPERQYAEVSSLIRDSGSREVFYPAVAQAGTEEAVAYLADRYRSGSEAAFDALVSVDSFAAADDLFRIAEKGGPESGAALSRFVDLVSASSQSSLSKVSEYEAVADLLPDAGILNKVLSALAGTPVMPAFVLACRYLDDSRTAYQAANAVRSIAGKTDDAIDYSLMKSSLEKAAEIYAAAGGADDGYAVDEIRKMLSELQPPEEKFVLPEEEAEAGYEVLFDGTGLSEWTGDMEGYTAVNGTIFVTAGYGDSRNLYTKKEYSDFILRFDFCFVKPGVNNGVGIRTPMGKDAAYWGMCECQILDHDDPVYKGLHEYQVHGSAYGIIPAKRVKHRPLGEWNSEEIKVVGDRITVTLNGEVILDGNLREACRGHNVAPDGSEYNPYTADHRNHPGMFNEKGHVGFLGHGAGIKFRNVRILDLGK